MKITYIYHSCYAIETPQSALIFDYFMHGGKPLEDIVTAKKSIYVFSSHAHGDHFNPEIFNWKAKNANITYILSADIPKSRVPKTNGVIFLQEGEQYQDDTVSVTAYGSTDCGVSFFVSFGGKTIFHAGDLNNWHWNEEVPAEEAEGYSRAFLEKLEDISRSHKALDIVMFPTDPRLGRDYLLGASQFADKIKTGVFAPMHFGDNYDSAKALRLHETPVFAVSKKGESMEVN
ncbi:MAG: MBL fold metallo-hydrolase [Clostridiales bacterium]|nr:MBL fold metallo-hydrolase [Clostridiales bacterium]